MDVKVGDRVRCGVYVCNEFQPTYEGKVVSLESGYARVDICPWGAPWIVSYNYSELRPLEEKKWNLP